MTIAATTNGAPAPAFVAPATTARAHNQTLRLRTKGSGKRQVTRVMRPTLRQVQVGLRKNQRALDAAKAGSPLAAQLKTQRNKMITYVNSLAAQPGKNQ